MRMTTRIAACALALLTGSAARADIVEARSTTLLTVGQQTRNFVPGQAPQLVDVAPLYEILSISARDVSNPIADDLRIEVSTWGSYDLADRRWDNGTTSSVTGDVMTGLIRGALLGRHLVLSVGRQYVAQGTARMIQLDGGEAIVQLPGGIGVSGYAGSPVSQRFTRRTETISWNPAGGDLAYGGRAFWRYGFAGPPGRGIELGASYAFVSDAGDPARRDVGFDLRVQPSDRVSVTANGVWSLLEKNALEEGNVAVTWSPVRRLQLAADVRRLAPDLFLPRTSVLSVFGGKERTGAGVGASYDLSRGITVSAEGHLDWEPKSKTPVGSFARPTGQFVGYDALARAVWRRADTSLGAELQALDAEDNGYQALRLFGRQELGKLFVALDLLGHVFRDEINGEKTAATGTLTGGYVIGAGWEAVIAGRAGVTPFLEQQYDLMAKLVYNQTYRVREVR